MSQQLSFFEILDRPAPVLPKQPAEVFLFTGMRKRLAQTAASDVLARPLEKQAWHRRDQLNIFRNRMRAAGLPPAAIDREVQQFAVDMECELRRQIICSILEKERA